MAAVGRFLSKCQYITMFEYQRHCDSVSSLEWFITMAGRIPVLACTDLSRIDIGGDYRYSWCVESSCCASDIEGSHLSWIDTGIGYWWWRFVIVVWYASVSKRWKGLKDFFKCSAKYLKYTIFHRNSCNVNISKCLCEGNRLLLN